MGLLDRLKKISKKKEVDSRSTEIIAAERLQELANQKTTHEGSKTHYEKMLGATNLEKEYILVKIVGNLEEALNINLTSWVKKKDEPLFVNYQPTDAMRGLTSALYKALKDPELDYGKNTKTKIRKIRHYRHGQYKILTTHIQGIENKIVFPEKPYKNKKGQEVNIEPATGRRLLRNIYTDLYTYFTRDEQETNNNKYLAAELQLLIAEQWLKEHKEKDYGEAKPAVEAFLRHIYKAGQNDGPKMKAPRFCKAIEQITNTSPIVKTLYHLAKAIIDLEEYNKMNPRVLSPKEKEKYEKKIKEIGVKYQLRD